MKDNEWKGYTIRDKRIPSKAIFFVSFREDTTVSYHLDSNHNKEGL